MNGLVNIGGSSTATYAWLKTPIIDGEKNTANSKYIVSENAAEYPECDSVGDYFYEKLPLNADIVNSVINEYYAYNEDISAESFVEFVEGTVVPVQTKAVGANEYNTDNFSVCRLNETRVLLVYASADKNTIYGLFIDIINDSITIGSPILIYTNDDSPGEDLNAVAVSESKIVILLRAGEHPAPYLSGLVVDINGDTLTAGLRTQLSTAMYSCSPAMRVYRLTDDRVFIAYDGSNSVAESHLYGMVASIEGNSITPLTSSIIHNGTYTSDHELVMFDQSRMLILHMYDGSSDDNEICATMVHVSDDSIDVVSQKKIYDNTSTTNGDFHAIALDETTVLILHVYSVYNTYSDSLMGFVIRIDGDEISEIGKSVGIGPSTSTREYWYDGKYVTAMKIVNRGEHQILIIHSKGEEYYLNATLLSIDGTTITMIYDTELYSTEGIGKPLESVMMSDDVDTSILSVINSTDVALIKVLPDKVKAAETEIYGITKDDITTTTSGRVWTLA